MTYCSNCGTKLLESQKYCLGCGAKIQWIIRVDDPAAYRAAHAPEPEPEPKKKKKK